MDTQNYLIYQNGSQTVLAHGITRAEITTRDSFGEALEQALSQLDQANEAGRRRGGHISIASGDYRLDRSLAIPERVTLKGDGVSTRIEISNPDLQTAFNIEQSDFVCVKDLMLTGGDEQLGDIAIRVSDSGNVTLQGLYIGHFKTYGVQIANNAHLCQVLDSTLAGNGKAHVSMRDLKEGRRGDYMPNDLKNLTIFGGGRAVEMVGAIVVNIVGCTIYQTNDTAFHIRDWTNSVLITGCRTFQITGNVIDADNLGELNVSSNIFCWHTLDGIVLKDCKWGTISGNEIIDSGSFNPGGTNLTTKLADVNIPRLYSGLTMQDVRGYTISGNAFFNWDVVPKMKSGIIEDESCYNNVITSNNVNYMDEAGIVSLGRETTCANNVCEEKVHHQPGADLLCQSYQPEVTAAYIKELFA